MAAQRKGGLGRGLGALLPTAESNASQEAAKLVSVKEITTNPHQPRSVFQPEELQELADSIKEHGIIQPLIVSQDESNSYILIAGERRLRAAELAGLTMVPVVIRNATEQELLELALIENVQREDLSPLETAEAYRNLEESFHLTHEEISKRVGKNRVSVTNTLRLLKLPQNVLEALAEQKISEGHARALLALSNAEAQSAALQQIIGQDLNVRQTEELVRKINGVREKEKKQPVENPELKSLEDELMQAFGTKVSLHPGKTGGTIHIHYYSDEELDTLISRFKAN